MKTYFFVLRLDMILGGIVAAATLTKRTPILIADLTQRGNGCVDKGAMVGLAVMEVPVVIGGLGRFSKPLMGPSKDNLAPCSGTPSTGSPSDGTCEVSFKDANSRD